MRAVKMSILAGAVLATGFATKSEASGPELFVYSVIVKTNFGTHFTDCFSFYNGTLTVSGLGTLKYTPAPTDPKHYYTAVPTIDSANAIGFNIAFAGYKVGNATSGAIHAVGSDQFRDSYTIRGTTVAACPSITGSHNWSNPAN